jgi:hypothetical protein
MFFTPLKIVLAPRQHLPTPTENVIVDDQRGHGLATVD